MSEHLKLALEACPFCGGEAKVWARGMVWYIECVSCRANTAKCNTQEGAVNSWNRRAPALEGRAVTDEDVERAAAAIGKEMFAWTVPYKSQVRWPTDYTDDEQRRCRRAAKSALAMQPPQPTTGT